MLASQIKSAKNTNKGLKGTVGDSKEVKFGKDVGVKESGGYMGMVSFHIDKVLNLTQGKTNNSDLSPIDKLEIIEIKLSEMLEVRNKLIEYGDYNLQKELKDLENILDRNRKNNKLQRKRDQEQQDKLEKLIKSAKRIENQQKIQVFNGRKLQARAPKTKYSEDKEKKEVYNEHEADLNRYVYN